MVMHMKKLLIVTLGCLVVVLAVLSSLFVAALATGKSPADFFISKQKAAEIAQQQVTGTVTGIESATSGSPAYKVEIVNGVQETEVVIDAATGAVIATEEDLDKSNSYGNSISEADAKSIALLKIGGTVTDVEMKRLNGRVAYEIEIQKNGTEADVSVDATTGEIIRIEQDGESDSEESGREESDGEE